jgi:hypothetical protein
MPIGSVFMPPRRKSALWAIDEFDGFDGSSF